ncbi:MAG: ABC transporter ATP-binding protein [Dehalococcoidia bacterium]|nr:ABC transporter ATP-binding protein [Dehalococcoidia bacterium]
MDVVKTYDTGYSKVPALKGVSLSVERGEMVAIMGPSGCGKTTLLNCLSGLDDIDSGQIIVDGTDINRLSDNAKTEYRARNMGFVFQVYDLLPILSAVENVELPLLVSGTAAKASREAAMRALEFVHLANRASHRPAELSGGERQRVAVARSLVNEPAIVWADEPTGALDSTNADDIMNLLRELNESSNQTFVVVTHDSKMAAYAQRIVYMVDGLIVDEKRTAHAKQPSSPTTEQA